MQTRFLEIVKFLVTAAFSWVPRIIKLGEDLRVLKNGIDE